MGATPDTAAHCAGAWTLMAGEEQARPPDPRLAPRAGERADERPRFAYFEVRMFGLLTLFFVAAAVIYYVWSQEWAGTVLFALSSGLAALTGGYLFLQARLERQLSAVPDEGLPSEAAAPADEEYLPHASPWPLELGFGMTLAMVGLVLGRWVFLAGAVFGAHALYGWVDQSRRRA